MFLRTVRRCALFPLSFRPSSCLIMLRRVHPAYVLIQAQAHGHSRQCCNEAF